MDDEAVPELVSIWDETKGHIDQGEYEKAIELVMQYLQNVPITFYVLVKSGAAGQADSLIENIKTNIEGTNPEDSVFYWRCQGFAHVAAGNGDSAVYYLEKVSEIQSLAFRDYITKNMLATAYLLSDKLPQSISEFEKIQFSYHYNSAYGTTFYIRGHYLLGQAYEKSNWHQKAIEQYELFIDIWKDDQPPVKDVEDARARLAKLKGST